jgi:pimeloyl-ACP methyl ester carboxylesterase
MHIERTFRGGTGTPLVLLHGLGGSWTGWQPLIPLLSDEHDVFAPTLAGHRGGPALDLTRPVDIALLTDELETALDESGFDRAHIVGNSVGGWVALEAARRGRARSVVALSPAGAWRTDRDRRRVVAQVRIGAGLTVRSSKFMRPLLRLAPLRRAWFATMMSHGDRLSPAAADDLLRDFAACTALRPFTEWWRTADPLPRLDHACPVRIAWSDNDRTLPFEKFGKPLLKRVERADWLLMPGVGHVPMYDDPRLVAQTILDFTQQVDASDKNPSESTSR